jgi:hypothetical protein
VGPRDGGRKPGGGQRPGWGGEERAGGGCSVKCRREGDADKSMPDVTSYGRMLAVTGNGGCLVWDRL